MKCRGRLRTLVTLMGSLALLAGPGALTGRADNIDQKLLEQGPRLIKECRDRGYRTVGTLKFRVKLPGQSLGFHVEPLCSNLADRVENLLVLANDPENPVGVLHAAGVTAAARNARVSYLSPAGRKQLLEYGYFPAWGRGKESADAFFTGHVTIRDDLRSADVVVEVFDPAVPGKSDGTLRRVVSFTVEIDRSILADAGLVFRLGSKSRSAESSLPAATRDREAAAAALARRKEISGVAPPASSGTSGGSTPRTAPASAEGKPELLQVSVLVDDKELTASRASGLGGAGTLPLPRAGQQVALKLRNVSPQTLGVLLRVSGRSTIAEQIDEASRCRRWVLEPGKVQVVRGYYTGEDQWRPFRLAHGPAAAERSGPASGSGNTAARPAAPGELTPTLQNLVEVQVFVAGDKEERRRVVSLRGLPEADRKDSPGWELKTLQIKLQTRGGLRRVGVRAFEPDAVPPTGDDEKLQNATFAEAIRLRFGE